MAKPAFWVVYVPGFDPEKFMVRFLMRRYVNGHKAAGRSPIIKPAGF